jgi:hypothetical protein
VSGRPNAATASGDTPGLGDSRLSAPLTQGVVAAVVMIAVLGGLAVLSVQPFASADEHAHADYGLTLYTEQRLPTLFDTVESAFPFQKTKPQHVANHPPLYYLLIGPPLRAGLESGHPETGFLVARGISVLASMAAVVMVAVFAHTLMRGRRPAAAVGAAALAAVYAPFVSVTGALHNDALAVAFSSTVLWLVVLVMRRGLGADLLIGLGVAALGGVSVRASNASLVLIASLAVLVAALIHAPPTTRWRSGLATGLAASVAVGLTSVAGIGWFFLRNLNLYGNPLGYGVLDEAFGKTPPPQPLWLLRNPVLLIDQLGLPRPEESLTVSGLLTALPALAVTAGLVLTVRAAWRRSRSRGADEPAVSDRVGSPVREPTARSILGGLFLLHALITVVMVIRHVDGGGGIHVRYLFPLLPIAATLAAVALLQLPGGRRGAYVVAAVVAGVLTTLETVGRSAWRWAADREPGAALDGITQGLTRIGIPYPSAAVAAALLVVGAAGVVVAVSMWRLGGQPGSGSATGQSQPPEEPIENQPRAALA